MSIDRAGEPNHGARGEGEGGKVAAERELMAQARQDLRRCGRQLPLLQTAPTVISDSGEG